MTTEQTEPAGPCSCGAPIPCIAPRFGGEHVPRETWEKDQIDDGMLQWDPGTLSSYTIDRIITDALSDQWYDCYRRDMPEAQRRNLFREKLMEQLRCATGQTFRVL